MTGVRIGLPWYVHPAEDGQAWDRLARLRPRPSFVVVNVHDGPGAPADPWYPDTLAKLRGVRLVGYVDVGYGRRPPAEVEEDVRAWLGRYGLAGIMLDQLPADQGSTGRCSSYVSAARRQGAGLVVGNPGTVPTPEHLAMLDVTCVFEGRAVAYAQFRPPANLRRVPPGRVWHLVHSCPPEDLAAVTARTGELGAGHAFVTDRCLPHPWGGFPHGTGRASPGRVGDHRRGWGSPT